MTHIEDVLLIAVAQDGKEYEFGAEVNPADPNSATEYDCSELIEVAVESSTGAPFPDGAYNQWMLCKRAGTMLGLEEARSTRGALLFTGDGTGVGRDAITHVAISLGDSVGRHRTIEARGEAYGVGRFSSVGRFNYGALIPGIDYSSGRAPLVQPTDPNGYTPYPGGVWKVGARGPFVRTIQHIVAAAGCGGGEEDGIFGDDTKAGVVCWQARIGADADGQWGSDTQQRTDAVFRWLAAQTARPVATGPTLRLGAHGPAVKRLQERLHVLGYGGRGVSSFDGNFGPAVQARVREFQADYEIDVDGVVGPDTWAKLG